MFPLLKILNQLESKWFIYKPALRICQLTPIILWFYGFTFCEIIMNQSPEEITFLLSIRNLFICVLCWFITRQWLNKIFWYIIGDKLSLQLQIIYNLPVGHQSHHVFCFSASTSTKTFTICCVGIQQILGRHAL